MEKFSGKPRKKGRDSPQKNLPSGLPNGKATMNNSPKTRGSQGYKPGSKHPIGCSNTPQKGKTYDNGVTQCCLLSFSKNSLKQKGQKAATQSTHGYKGSQSNAGENRKMENFKINNNNKFNKAHGNAPNGECKKFCLRHEWNHTYASDNCKILIAEPEKLKHQHEAGSKKPHRRVEDNYKKKLLLKKDLHALIDERIALNKNKGFTFATLKNAKKYLEKHQNEIESDSDSSDSN